MISFPFEKPPEPGQICEIIPNLYWLRMKLPMYINHVNVYVFREHNGITVVDTGLNVSSCIVNWEKILKTHFSGLKVTRVIATHHHPDHIGLLGWFCDNHDVKVFASRSSWLLARMLYLDEQKIPSREAKDFWIKAGMDKKTFQQKCKLRPFNFSDGVAEFPVGFIALNQGDEICLSDKKWSIEIGNGHAPEHVTLWGIDTPIVIVGDQVIPGISSNLGVYPTEPLLDTVGAWLQTCNRFLQIAKNDHLVLPGHKLPFYGLSVRLKQLIDNHLSALNRIEIKLAKGSYTAVDLFHTIFKRDIREIEYSLALAEAVGHVNYFRARNMVETSIRQDGALLFKLK